jgi:glycosyltransferase involved in cell wall biosynthesis
MKVLMFGWEFPPFYSGGLGPACAGLTKGLTRKGVHVTFVIPRKPSDIKTHVNLVSAEEVLGEKLIIKEIPSLLTPYVNSESYKDMLKNHKGSGELYGANLFEEVKRYALAARKIAEQESFDVIHAHDWLTFLAGIEAKKVSKKPLVTHVHATEFDRTGMQGVNQHVYDIEKQGMEAADAVTPVSHFTKELIVKHYGINPDKIHVVHNAVEFENADIEPHKLPQKTVLFLGRVTIQKGPDYFIDAAKKVLEVYPDVRFVVAGSGDMETDMIEKASHYGIGDKVLFTGFLRGPDIDRAYRMADVYVMPSVSEPFGLTPLEAIKNGTPAIISKQSGVSEVLKNALKVDFWDVNELANKICGVLKHKALKEELLAHEQHELGQISWDKSADTCHDVYRRVLGQ